MIERLTVRGFKSIGDEPVKLELRPITILVGKNGSGKSSLLEAVGILAESVAGRGNPPRGELVDAFSYEAVRHRAGPPSKQTPSAEFEVSVQIRPLANAAGDGVPIVCHVSRAFGAAGPVRDSMQSLTSGSDAICAQVGIAAMRNVYRLTANRGQVQWVHQPASVDVDWVGRNAQDLDSILRKIFSSGAFGEAKGKIQRWCRAFGLENLHPDDYMDSELEASLPRVLASEGSRQMCSVVVQVFWSPPDSLIMVEEPELSLHPQAQVDLCELFAEAVEDGKQLLITSHSPLLLQALAIPVQKGRLNHESVIVHEVEKRGDEGTRIKGTYELDGQGILGGWISSFAVAEKKIGRAFSRSLPEA